MSCRYLFIGPFDWANISNRVARAINATLGTQTARCVNKPHPFGYKQDIELRSDNVREVGPLLYDLAPEVEWIIACDDSDRYHTFGAFLREMPFSQHARLATMHVGSAYRDEPADWNRVDDAMAFDRRIIGGDLLRFALDDPTAVPFFAPPHADPVTSLTPVNGAPRISHSPSVRGVKGTDDIVKALDGFNLDVIEKVSFDECQKRRAQSHIFVDQLKPDIGGFGASSVEAMAAGCVTLASIDNIVQRVDDFYPPPPIVPVNSPNEVRAVVEELVQDPAQLQRERQQALNWAKDVASQKAIARYWMDVVLK